MSLSDVWVARLGAELRPIDRLALRLGYIYRPTPVPDQGRRTSYLDCTAHVLSLGAGWSFDDPLQIATRLGVDAAVQLAVMAPRSVERSPFFSRSTTVTRWLECETIQMACTALTCWYWPSLSPRSSFSVDGLVTSMIKPGLMIDNLSSAARSTFPHTTDASGNT